MTSFRKPAVGVYPVNNFPDYRSSAKRAPNQPAIAIQHSNSETTGPQYGAEMLGGRRADMTRNGNGGAALGQRIIVFGQVTDATGRAQANTLVEAWQANAAGRYRHAGDQHDAPLDPNFSGAGATLTDREGHYRFLTIEPGAYPWGNHFNAWRPKHIHFSLFGPAWATRLVTQMYFPGDPTLAYDPIYNSIEDVAARERLVAKLDMEHSEADFAMAYRFDIVLRGRGQTPLECAS